MFMFKLTYKSTLLKWLVHAQIYCALFSVYNNLRDESKGIDIFIKANDAILPVLLANSFKFVNTNVYDITNPNKTMALIALIYCISMPLMKFYCIFEYILHEIEILCESKSVTWMPNKIWIISTCLLQLIIFNLCNIAIRI